MAVSSTEADLVFAGGKIRTPAHPSGFVQALAVYGHAANTWNGIPRSVDEMPQRLWDAPSHAAVVLAWKIYTYRLAQPLATAWAYAREIPLLSADNVLLQIPPGAPYITLGLRRGTSATTASSGWK